MAESGNSTTSSLGRELAEAVAIRCSHPANSYDLQERHKRNAARRMWLRGIGMACSSVEGASTLSEARLLGLYQYICVSSFPKKDDASDVPGAKSTKTLAEVPRLC